MGEKWILFLAWPLCRELISSLILAAISFVVPFSLGHSQFLTGVIVNASLFLVAVFLPARLWLLVVILPSAGVLARGLIFGPLTPFLIYFLPFIWLGNLVLMAVFAGQKSRLGTMGAILLASAAKFFLLFSSAQVYFHFKIVPKLFLQTMGIYQFITAVSGGLLVYFFLKRYYGHRNP